MGLGSIGNPLDALPRAAFLPGGEAKERVPASEASEPAEAPARAPLPSYAGTRIDTEA